MAQALDGRVPRNPTPIERARLVAALVDALDYARMEQLAAFVFDVPVGDIFPPKSLLSEIALLIVLEAERRDLVRELQREALERNDDNPLLQSWFMVSSSQADSPYRGFAPFGERDEAIFYGRDAVVGQLVTAVDERAIVTVVGPSGSGKSSVVFAGLVPSLCRSDGWLYRSFRLGDCPFTALAKALIRLLEPEMSLTSQIVERDNLARGLREQTIALTEVLDEIRTARQSSPRLLLVADQFEKLFSPAVDDATRNAFLEVLLAPFLGSSGRPPPYVLVLIMRADYLGRVKSHPILGEALPGTELTLGPMTDDDLRKTLVRPAAQREIELPAGLPDLVLEDVKGQPGSLSLLQFTMTRLNELLFGGKRDQPAFLLLPQVEAALIKHADDAVAELGGESPLLRRIFSHLFVLGEDGAPVRRPASRQELGEEAWNLVDRLADKRLVVTDYDEQRADATVEVTHKALLHNWPRVQDWLAQDAEFLRWLDELRDSLEKWQELQGQPEAEEELLQGGDLVVAEKWQRDRGVFLSPAQNDYIALSLAKREQDEKDAREERERAQRAEINRRSLFLLIAIGVGLIVALTLGLIVREQGQTGDARAQAASIQLAQLARDLADDELDLALLLGIEAQPQRTEQARDGLLRSLAAAPYLAAILAEDGQAVLSAGFSPDGRYLAGGDAAGSIHVWDLDNPNRRYDSPLQDNANAPGVRSLAFGKDHVLATGMMDGTVVFWQITDGDSALTIQEVYRFEGHEDTVSSLAFDREGRWLASGSVDGTILRWQIPSSGPWDSLRPEPFIPPRAIRSSVTSLAFAPDGEMLATSGANGPDGTILLWNVATRGLRGMMRANQTGPIWSIAYSPADARLLATGGDDGVIVLWDVDKAAPMQRLELDEAGVTSLAFSWDGATLAASGWDNSIGVWKVDPLPSGEEAAPGAAIATLERRLVGSDDRVTSLAFRPRERTLVSSGFDGALLLWDLDRSYLFREPFGSVPPVRSVALSPDGTRVAAVVNDNAIRTARLDDPRAMTQELRGHEEGPLSVAFSPDSTLLASAGKDDTIRLWDAASGEERGRCEGHEDDVMTLAFLSNDRLVARDAAGAVALWNIAAGSCQEGLPPGDREPDVAITSIAATSDGKTFASGDSNGLILVSDAATYQTADPISLEQQDLLGVDVTSLAFSADGATLVSGRVNGTVTLWDLSQRPPDERQRIQAESEVKSVAVFPAAGLLAVGGSTGAITLWSTNLQQEKEIVVLTEAERRVFSLAFAPDGRRLVSGGAEGIIIWDLDPKSWVDLACGLVVHRDLDREDEWPRFFPAREGYRATCSDHPSG